MHGAHRLLNLGARSGRVVGGRLVWTLLAVATLSGCLEPNVDPASRDDGTSVSPSEPRLEILFGAITEDGAWAVFDHVNGPCLSIAGHAWKLTDGAGRERDSEPLVWEDTGGPHPGGPAEWCPGERRVFDAADSGVSRLRIVDPKGGTVAIIDGPGPFEVSFSRNENSDELIVVMAVEGADWNRLAIEATTLGTSVRLEADPGTEAVRAHASDPDVTKEFQRLSPTPLQLVAGDYLAFCADDGAAATMTYTIVDLWSNTVLYVTTFQAIAACA
ncbi:MAG: hypothetical protein QOJ26_850 [Thermoplasmata archaeon]|nr:hypothetical protein [Thermoplasmata archaeon]